MGVKKDTIIFSCGVQGCCPSVEFKGEDVLVKDDFGNVSKMKKEQWLTLAKKSLEKI